MFCNVLKICLLLIKAFVRVKLNSEENVLIMHRYYFHEGV